VKPAYPELLIPLSGEAYAELRTIISKEGLRMPIQVDADTGDILDGWHRYQICRELGLTPRTEARRFPSEEEGKWFCISQNLHHTAVMQSQKAAFIVKYELPAALEKARERVNRQENGQYGKVDGPGEKGTVRAILAKQYGISESTIELVKRLAKVSPEEFEKVLRGEKGSYSALSQLGIIPPNHSYKVSKPPKEPEPQFCEHLLADLKRKRKEQHIQLTGRLWNVETSIKAELIEMLDWLQRELERYVNEQPGNSQEKGVLQ
jgi:hypothetical protein